MLKQRIYTALALVCSLLGVVLFLPAIGFGLALALLMAAAAWEWARLNHWPRSAWIWAILTAITCLLLGIYTLPSQSWIHHLPPWGIVAVLWILLFIPMVIGKDGWWLRIPSFMRLFTGLVLLTATWWALFEMRSHSLNFLISAMALIWVADIGAYFAGRLLGGRLISRKLAPSLSPKKTWEGVIGGFMSVLLVSAAWVAIELALAWQPSVMRLLWLQYGIVGAALVLALVMVFAVLGDLFESMMKRNAEVKDSSALLPGHGGVLDRVDALLPTMPLILWLL